MPQDGNRLNQVSNPGLSKRDYLKVAGSTAVGLSLAGCSDLLGSDSSGSSGLDEQEERTLRFAATSAPDPEEYNFSIAHHFKQQVESLSDGKLTVEIHPSGELGGVLDVHDQLTDGSLALANGAINILTPYYSNFEVFDIPWTVPSQPVASALYRSPLMNELNRDMASNAGLRILGTSAAGNVFSFSGASPTSVNKLEGLALPAGFTETESAGIEALGMVPESVALPELYSSLEQGVIDGVNYGKLTWVSYGVEELLDFYIDQPFKYAGLTIDISEQVYQDLSSVYQSIVSQAGARAAHHAEKTLELREQGFQQMTEEQGITSHNPSDSFVSSMQDTTRDRCTEVARNQVDNSDMVDRYLQQIDEIVSTMQA